jgi:uncharacterized protein with von Willebrand factor type A (vWA) domain
MPRALTASGAAETSEVPGQKALCEVTPADVSGSLAQVEGFYAALIMAAAKSFALETCFEQNTGRKKVTHLQRKNPATR